MITRFFLAILVAVAGTFSCRAQRPAPPSTDTQRWFDQKIGVENSGLINGQQYKMKMFSAKTNPFFEEGEAQGTVQFNQQIYNATVLYDTYQDVVVVKQFSQNGTGWFVQLDKKSVDSFSIRNHVFRKINDAFYDVLFDGSNLLVLSKRSKITALVKSVNSYLVNDEFFVVDAGRWSRLSSARGMTTLVKNKTDKEKVKSFIKEKKISSRNFSDDDLVNIATYISSLRENTLTP